MQWRAARYVCNRWHNTSSVSAMLHELSWESFARRRERARLCMIYKVVHGLVDTPWLQNKVLTPNPQCTRGYHSWKYAPTLPHNDTFIFSFIPRTIIAWNALHPVVVDCTTLRYVNYITTVFDLHYFLLTVNCTNLTCLLLILRNQHYRQIIFCVKSDCCIRRKKERPIDIVCRRVPIPFLRLGQH